MADRSAPVRNAPVRSAPPETMAEWWADDVRRCAASHMTAQERAIQRVRNKLGPPPVNVKLAAEKLTKHFS
jgi:hypothetical protein